jgi:hypothetical protein
MHADWFTALGVAARADFSLASAQTSTFEAGSVHRQLQLSHRGLVQRRFCSLLFASVYLQGVARHFEPTFELSCPAHHTSRLCVKAYYRSTSSPAEQVSSPVLPLLVVLTSLSLLTRYHPNLFRDLVSLVIFLPGEDLSVRNSVHGANCAPLCLPEDSVLSKHSFLSSSSACVVGQILALQY